MNKSASGRYLNHGLGGRNKLQESRRQKSREAILDAATQIFFEKPFLVATTDDIIKMAGVSRATFYTHFDSKMALAWDVFEAASNEWLILFDELPDIDFGDPDVIVTWLEKLIAVMNSHGYISTIFRQLDIIEDEVQRRTDDLREELIQRLGKRLEAFAGTEGAERASRARKVRAHNLLQQIDHLCARVAPNRVASDTDIHLRVTAEDISRFLKGQ